MPTRTSRQFGDDLAVAVVNEHVVQPLEEPLVLHNRLVEVVHLEDPHDGRAAHVGVHVLEAGS